MGERRARYRVQRPYMPGIDACDDGTHSGSTLAQISRSNPDGVAVSARSALLSALKRQGREREREESSGNGCTRRCLSAVSLSDIRVHAEPPTGGRDRRFPSVSSSSVPLFFRCLVASSFSRPIRCPLCANVPALFLSLSLSLLVCLLPVGIHPSIRITFTEEFYRGRCSLLIKAFRVCVRRNSPARLYPIALRFHT